MRFIEKEDNLGYVTNLGILLNSKFMELKEYGYYETYLRKKNLLEKRKLLSLLLYVATNLEIEEICALDVKNFKILVERIKSKKDEGIKRIKNIEITIGSFCRQLLVNLEFCYFFITEDFYDDFTKNKKPNQPTISSIVETEKPLQKSNLKKRYKRTNC